MTDPLPPPADRPAVPVVLAGVSDPKLADKIDGAGPQDNIPPTTTGEEDRKTKGQRDVNLIWELTQAVISITITGAVIYASLIGKSSETLTSAFVLVVSMYLVRTNHTKVGGVGGTDSR